MKTSKWYKTLRINALVAAVVFTGVSVVGNVITDRFLLGFTVLEALEPAVVVAFERMVDISVFTVGIIVLFKLDDTNFEEVGTVVVGRGLGFIRDVIDDIVEDDVVTASVCLVDTILVIFVKGFVEMVIDDVPFFGSLELANTEVCTCILEFFTATEAVDVTDDGSINLPL